MPLKPGLTARKPAGTRPRRGPIRRRPELIGPKLGGRANGYAPMPSAALRDRREVMQAASAQGKRIIRGIRGGEINHG